jgi:diguanylate cyclase (GGDEF)-like protein
MNKEVMKVWALTIFSIGVLWGLGNVSVGVASKVLGANAIIYTCSLFIGASFSLLLYAGNGGLGKETLRSIDTWGYGLVLIIGFLFSFVMFSYVTAVEGALLQRFSVVGGILAGWMFFGRSIGLQKIIGSIFVIIGVFYVASGGESENRAMLYILIILFAVLQASRAMLAEAHKTHNYATESQNKKDKIRVVGYIMFVVAMMFLGFSFVFSCIEYFTQTKVSTIIPDLKEFTNPASIFFGLIVGMILIAPIRLIEFAAASKIKSENYLALGALSPFSTLFWEWVTSPITGLSLREFTFNDMLAGLIILLGGLIIAFSKAKKQITDDVNEYVVHTVSDIQAVEDSRDLLGKSLTHFNGSMEKTSKTLGISENVIKAVLEGKEISLRREIFDKVARIYRKDISSKDALTGLLNRTGLMHSLDKLIDKKKDFTLFYIDLNKFKPINDNYGHEAGDEALQIIASRLSVYHKNSKIVSRLGGDEFVMVLEKKLDTKEFIDSLHIEIEKFFTLKTVNMVVSVSASIGYVKSSEMINLNSKDLLDIADKMMLDLKEKNER